jgi:hypothetical protein
LKIPRLAILNVAVLAGLALVPCSAAIEADAESRPPQQPLLAAAARPVTVAIDRFDPGLPVPQRFLGLSFEAAALGQLGQYSNRGDLVGLLRSLGSGMLRFGGITSDENVAWSDAATPRPAWASSTIGPAQMNAIGLLARRSGWQVLLTVGLAHYEPTAAAREVAAAHRALGRYLAAVEIGNEPDAYGRHGLRELPWIAQGYEEEVSDYREAIEALTPDVPIAGPDVSGSGAFAEWGEEEATAQTPALLTGHHYPLGCAQTPAPSIEELLSSQTRGRAAHSLASYLAVAHRNGIPLRIDETNTVSCGGVAGISNTFASALWATGYITQAMAAGVAGINLEGNPVNCTGYTPVCAPDANALAQGALRAQPEWYALLLTKSLVGKRPLPTSISVEGPPNPAAGSPGSAQSSPSSAQSSPSSAQGPPVLTERATNLVAAAFSGSSHTVQIVLADNEPPGASPLALRLDVGAGIDRADILRLTAPAQNATGGVQLAGREVTSSGSWIAPVGTESIAAHDGVLALELAPDSAALVTTSRPGARAARGRHLSAVAGAPGPVAGTSVASQ